MFRLLVFLFISTAIHGIANATHTGHVYIDKNCTNHEKQDSQSF